MPSTDPDFHDRLEVLSELDLFRGLSRRKLEALAGAVVLMRFEAGATIVRRHAAAEYFHVVVEGEVEIVDSPRPRVSVGPGDYFGEHAVAAGTAHEADAVARARTAVYAVDRAAFLAAVGV